MHVFRNWDGPVIHNQAHRVRRSAFVLVLVLVLESGRAGVMEYWRV
jgi:hypothetical protein